MSTALPSVVCAGLGFDWPDGTPALDSLDLTVPPGRTGLIGRNGSGKSTLLRLVTGELTPARGTVAAPDDVALLPQRLPLDTARTVADLLGVAAPLRALRAIAAGAADPANFTALGDDWDVETRARQALARFAAPAGDAGVLDRTVGTLSGGETVLVALAGLWIRRAALTLLDEPTVNLDAAARNALYEAIESWPGGLIVVSHDRDLLERMDRIVELRGGAARTFTGPFSAYEAALAVEQEAAARHVRAAESDLAREKRQYVAAQVTLARRRRTADTAEREKRVPKIVAHGRRQQAQVSAGKLRGLMAGRLDEARVALGQARDAVRDDDLIRIDLPATAVPEGRTVLRVGDLVVRGPERIALVGGNGAGKTTLLDAIAGRRAHPQPGVETPAVPTAYLPQRLDLLDDEASVLDNVRAGSGITAHAARAGLARFRIRGPAVEALAATLSGGERLRVGLARLLLADPAPHLLLLDEPTNSLDLDSVAQLTAALAGYRGALIVASHDRRFLDDIGVRRRWRVEDVGLPAEG